MENETKMESNKFSTPMAIVVAGALIAGALYFSSISGKQDIPKAGEQPTDAKLENLRPITSKDHIRGNINAPVKIVEYSDTECPFCKNFHVTMKKIMKEYEGEVAWIYRHFPIDSRHPTARMEAKATECANELGGNEKFWEYLDRIYEITPSNNGLDLRELPKIAEYIGLDKEKFNACLGSDRYDSIIEEDLQNANVTGGRGTPWNIVIAKDGKKYPIEGAQPYEVMKQVIDFALK